MQAMVDLAHSFDLRVVAEGVEDEPTAAILRRLGVDQAQGFLYSQAVPADDLPLTQSVPRPRRGRGHARRGRGGDDADHQHPPHATAAGAERLARLARTTRTGEYRAFRLKSGPEMPITTVSTLAPRGVPA